MQEMNSLRVQRFWGVAALALITAISVAVAILYLKPPGESTVSFYTDDAASLRPGDTVRIAGVVVGKVKDLAIEQDQVRVRVGVDQKAFVGDQSQVQVRMLTVVGGYYVSIVPLGHARLGNRPIPKERVTMPYNLMQTLADSTKITEGVATRPIKDSVDQLQNALTGTNTQTIRAVLDAGNSVTDMLNRQRGQITKILDLSDEYIDRLAKYNGRIEDYLRSISILEQTLILYGKAFGDGITKLGGIGWTLTPLIDAYVAHRDDFLQRIRNILGDFRTIGGRPGTLVRVLRRIHDRMEVALDKQNNFSRPELLATDICIPMHGSPC
jgi:phospholipid/cholesterol/gamma-HCH transport system substrate-binding protein